MTREELIDLIMDHSAGATDNVADGVCYKTLADAILKRISLPPAEGASNKFRDVLNEVQRLIEINDGATGGELRAIWNNLSFAITESERRSQPPAEGAETILKEGLDDGRYADITDGINIDVKQPFYQAIIRYAEDVVAAQPQPTAEGAEEYLKANLSEGEDMVISDRLRRRTKELLNGFATLHAQRIAEKMVSERLREELIKYDKYIGNKGWIDNYEDETAIPTVDEYLKSRER